MRRRIEILLLILGLTGVGIWIWSNVRLAVFQKQANQALDRVFSHPRTPHPAPVAPASPSRAPLPPDGALLGRLVIPRLKVQAAVREGAGEKTLSVALGHIPGTALPGQTGNVGIAGHRDTLFRALRHINEKDTIDLETPEGTYRYQVEDTHIVKPTDVEVLHAGTQPELTLVTCYPFYYVGPAPDRFIVKARLVNAPQQAEPVQQAAAPAVSAAAVSGEPVPPPAPPRARKPQVVRPVRQVEMARNRKQTPRKIVFQVNDHQPREVAPGIRMGLSWTDARTGRANGWIWMAPEQRTIWLHNQAVNQPLVFRTYSDGKERELVLTSVSSGSAQGYLLQISN